MKIAKLATATALSATLIGCATPAPPKSEEEIRNAYYGRELSQSECQDAAKRAIGQVLKDPYSAQYRFTDCRKNYLNQYSRYYYGYHIGGLVNGKNSYGGYVGETRFDVIIQDGVVIAKCIEKAGVETGCDAPYDWTTNTTYAR